MTWHSVRKNGRKTFLPLLSCRNQKHRMTSPNRLFVSILFLIFRPGNTFYINPAKHPPLSSNGPWDLQSVVHHYAASKSGDNNDAPSSPIKFPSIPVIGPIPSAPPLTLGGEYVLDPPTPLQWKSLQESIVIHKMASRDGDEQKKAGTIDAAPIIAFIDDVTGSSRVYPYHDSKEKGGRYATIAAVVGIKMKRQRERNEKEDDFMSFYNNIKDTNTISPLDCSIRLLGVGRACLHRFFYTVSNTIDDEIDASEEEETYQNDDFDEYDDGYEDGTPIIMANFQVILDDSSFHGDIQIDDIGQRGIRSPRSSPVYTLNYLYNIAQKVYRTHDRRRRITLGIKAGFYRLQQNAKRRNEAFLDDVDDYDGFGLLFESRKGIENNETFDHLTEDEWLSTITPGNDYGLNEGDREKIIKDLASLDNYGLNFYGSLSRIPDLANVLLHVLEPYYSKGFVSREENEFEISSFVAFRCLEGYINSSNIAWSLHCTSSIERLQNALDLMLDHEAKLKLVANYVNKKLQDCGEECSDLW